MIEARFRDPAGRPERPIPRRCVVLPVAGALTPPRPADMIFSWLAEEARRRDRDYQHPGCY